MASITHGMKKRMSKVTTRKKTIEANISSSYTTAKTQLLREKKAVSDALAIINESSGEAWVSVANAYKNFAELIDTESPIEGPLHAVSSDVVSAARQFHTDSSAELSVDDSITKMIGHVKAYIAEIESVESDFSKVETLFTETQRYEKKVDKLSTAKETGGKAERKKRNLDKLEGARAAQQSAIDAVLERMKRSSSKFEAVLQCAQTAFWLRQDKFVKLVTTSTQTARACAEGVRDEMVKMDITASELKYVSKSGDVAVQSGDVVSKAPEKPEVTPKPVSA